MSLQPDNKTVGQKALFYLGKRRLGPDFANIEADDKAIRWEGVRDLGEKALALTVAAAAGVTLAVLGARAFDTSDAARGEQNVHEATASSAVYAQLHPDPQQASMRIQTPQK